MIGQTISHYRVLETLGGGGMGVVYLAEDTTLGRKVALKFLPPDIATTPEAEARLLREARAASALNHPNICTVHEVGRHGDRPFIAMEWLDGETFKRRLDRGPLPVDMLLDLAEHIADALQTAHASGIIHRDLKPANLFLTRRGDAKILDFGLAKMVHSDDGATLGPLTSAGATVGTVAYMAPEQARGEQVDARSDLFSLGVVLYELTTGHSAFTASTTALTFDSILHRQPPSPRQLNRDIPDALDRIISRLLAKDAAERYQSARELADDLKRARRGDNPSSGTHKLPPSVAVLPFVNMSTDPESQFFSDGLAEELINALTRLRGLQVASRTSAFRFRGANTDIREIGRELKVGAVVEGSVRRAGNRLRVTAQLINVADGYHLWSERYDREMADVFAIQDDIVAAIVQALSPALMGDAQHAVRRPTENLEAYELYLKGRHYWHQRSPGALQQAIRCFDEVIALDPEYALAYAGIADCYSIFRVYGWHSAEATRSRALDAVTRAMTLDRTLGEVHYSQSLYTFFFEPKWRAAEAHVRSAIAINPRAAISHTQLAIILACVDRLEESAAEADAARELDPLSPVIHFMCACSFNTARRFDLAARAARRALELQPDVIVGLWPLAFALSGLGQHDEAVAVGERLVMLSRAPIFVGELGLVYARAGRGDAAKQLLAELNERQLRGEYVAPFARLAIHVGLEDIGGMRADLEACVTDRPAPLSIKSTCGPWLDAYRRDGEIDRLIESLYNGAPEP